MPETLRHATLRQLQIFLAAAQSGGFARAAADLHLSPPAVSMQMAQLAELVGQALFERAGRGLRLTAAGATLRPFAQRVVETLRDAGEALDALTGLQQGHLRIALVATTQYFAPRMLSSFRAAHPGIRPEVSIGSREDVIALLESGQVEVAIMGRPPTQMPVAALAFARHPHGIISPPDHGLVGLRRFGPKRLAGEQFIARETGSGTRFAMNQYFAQNAIAPTIVQEMSTNEAIKQAVMAGMGLAFISLHTVSLECQTGHLALLEVKGLPVVRSWYAVHLQQHCLSPAAHALLVFLRDEAQGVMDGLLSGLGPSGRAGA